MPRYDNGADWVVVAGAARRPMRELMRLDTEPIEVAHQLAVGLTTDAHFTDDAGQVVDWQRDVWGLSVQQWQWWKREIWAAARDEKIDPEV